MWRTGCRRSRPPRTSAGSASSWGSCTRGFGPPCLPNPPNYPRGRPRHGGHRQFTERTEIARPSPPPAFHAVGIDPHRAWGSPGNFLGRNFLSAPSPRWIAVTAPAYSNNAPPKGRRGAGVLGPAAASQDHHEHRDCGRTVHVGSSLHRVASRPSFSGRLPARVRGLHRAGTIQVGFDFPYVRKISSAVASSSSSGVVAATTVPTTTTGISTCRRCRMFVNLAMALARASAEGVPGAGGGAGGADRVRGWSTSLDYRRGSSATLGDRPQ
jgi:hypothetical protein